MTPFALSEVTTITELVVKHAADAFAGPERIAAEWRDLNFSSAPDYLRALDEYERLLELCSSGGAMIRRLPPGDGVGLDSIYVRDASIVTPSGIVLCRMGKPLRSGEPDAQASAFADWNVPVVGAIQPPGVLEGGDVVWLDERTVAVGEGYRTNAAGIAQLRALAGDRVEVVPVPLPHWRGVGDVFHLMSVLSPVDRDLAVVYSPLMPVPFRNRLIELGYRLIEVPDNEFESMGANVLAISPRRCIVVEGNPVTRQRLEAAGAEVLVYEGCEISVKGGGGPTCLTRPIRRQADERSALR